MHVKALYSSSAFGRVAVARPSHHARRAVSLALKAPKPTLRQVHLASKRNRSEEEQGGKETVLSVQVTSPSPDQAPVEASTESLQIFNKRWKPRAPRPKPPSPPFIGIPGQPTGLQRSLNIILKAGETQNSENFFQQCRDELVDERDQENIRDDQILTRATEYYKTPWQKYRTRKIRRSVNECLSDEMTAFAAYMTPTKLESQAADQTLEEARYLLPARCDVAFVGSRAFGLAVPHSNIDIHFSQKPLARTNPAAASRALSQRLLEYTKGRVGNTALGDTAFGKSIKMSRKRGGWIPSATRHNRSQLIMQAVVGEPIVFQAELIKSILRDLPSVRPIYLVLRRIMEIRRLLFDGNAGLDTYALLIMTIVGVKNSLFSGKTSLGHQLIHVLAFWADPERSTQAFTVEPFGAFSKTISEEYKFDNWQARGKGQSPLPQEQSLGIQIICQQVQDVKSGPQLCLQDPADYATNVARDVDLAALQPIFADLHAELLDGVKAADETDLATSLLYPLVKGNYFALELQWLVLRRFKRGDLGTTRDFTLQTMMKESEERMQLSKSEVNDLDASLTPRKLEYLIRVYQQTPQYLYKQFGLSRALPGHV